jgi:hypothetical protein
MTIDDRTLNNTNRTIAVILMGTNTHGLHILLPQPQVRGDAHPHPHPHPNARLQAASLQRQSIIVEAISRRKQS